MPTVSPLRDLTPNWFAAVMGTGIVANGAVLLPVAVPGLRALALALWIAAALLLAGMLTLSAVQGGPRRHLADAAMAPFLGMPAMALLTVGSGALLVGRDAIGPGAAVDLAAALWIAGTAAGLAAFAVVPRALRQRGPAAAPRPRARPARRDVQATWLLPVVPPLVSAATGAGLIAHLPTAATRGALLVACYLLFTLSLTASSALIVALLARLRRDGLPQAPLVPTLWIVLGPLGQSITAVTLLGAAATHAGLPHAAALRGFAIAYGVPVLVLALVWLAVVASITARTARRGGLPFTLTWWSFTFPVGTCVTGASELALHTGVGALAVLAAVLFAGLVAAWATTAARTARWLLSPRAAPTSPATPSPARLAPRPAR